MKQFIKVLTLAISAVALLALSVSAADPVVTLTSSNATLNTAAVYGSYTAADTNYTGTIRIYYGRTDGTNVAASWSKSVLIGTGFTNTQTYSSTLYDLPSSGITYARAFATEATSGATSNSATVTITTLTPGEAAFRENLRQGIIPSATITTNIVTILKIGGTNYVAGCDTITNSAGAVVKVLKLTP